MSSQQPDPSNPVFKTPQPDQLQSEASKETVRRTLSEEQGTETDVIDEDATERNNDAPTKRVGVADDMENLADRHPPILDSPPG